MGSCLGPIKLHLRMKEHFMPMELRRVVFIVRKCFLVLALSLSLHCLLGCNFIPNVCGIYAYFDACVCTLCILCIVAEMTTTISTLSGSFKVSM